ncbi:MAG TPA: hypothetical protein VGC74_08290, partial [Stenotrophomonas sp.]
ITMASKISVMVLAHDECCVGDCTGVLQRGGKRSDTVGEITTRRQKPLVFALWLSKEGQGSCFCPD